MATINFGGINEKVITRGEFPLSKAREVLKNETTAVIGYGVQGPAQALNMRDNGFNVIIGQPRGDEWNDRILNDGWIPGETLFHLDEAVKRATVIQVLVSDAAQMKVWPVIERNLNPGDALYFSHGFSVVYKDKTGVVPPKDVDVILVAPKGSGTSVRRNFLSGAGINSSVAVEQDATGHAEERCYALGIAVGSGFLFPTSFQKETFADLTSERGALMGGLAGLLEAQYEMLREEGHDPSEAFNETVEELTESLIVLVGEKGMDWMYENCSATAQRGALDWRPKFKAAVKPVFEELYGRVSDGAEAERVIKTCGQSNYHIQLAKELKEMRESEMWAAGETVRSLRPNEQAKKITVDTKGIAGRKYNV